MLIIRTPYPGAKRIVIACFGALFTGIALLTISNPPWHFTIGALLHSLAIIPFVLGALLFLAAAFDLESEWRVSRTSLVVVERTLFRTREHVLSRRERANARLVEHEWESSPRSFSVELRADADAVLRTYDTRDRAEAEHWLEAIVDAA